MPEPTTPAAATAAMNAALLEDPVRAQEVTRVFWDSPPGSLVLVVRPAIGADATAGRKYSLLLPNRAMFDDPQVPPQFADVAAWLATLGPGDRPVLADLPGGLARCAAAAGRATACTGDA